MPFAATPVLRRTTALAATSTLRALIGASTPLQYAALSSASAVPVTVTGTSVGGNNSRKTMFDPGVVNSGIPLGHPYPTEGGSVPIYSTMHGIVDKRNWEDGTPGWCKLCNEPIHRWIEHISRKDHALLDLHYTQLMETHRRWNPDALLRAVHDELGISDTEPFHRLFGRVDIEGRTQVFAMLMKLEEAGMLHFEHGRDTYLTRMIGGLRGLDHQGSLVLHECLMGPFLRLYPNGHIQDFSNLLDFISCSYNMETVYDMCGMYKLDKIALREHYGPSSPAALGLGGIATSSPAARGYENDLLESLNDAASAAGTPASAETPSSRQLVAHAARAAKLQEKAETLAFSRKTMFVRMVLGQLRWLLMPEQVHPAGYTFPPHIMTLGEVCLKALVVAIIETRLCEYMVRAEPVWLRFGLERRKLNRKNIVKSDDVVPRPVQFTYRPMASTFTDLYTCRPSAMDEQVQDGLTKRGLPPLKEFGAVPTNVMTTSAAAAAAAAGAAAAVAAVAAAEASREGRRRNRIKTVNVAEVRLARACAAAANSPAPPAAPTQPVAQRVVGVAGNGDVVHGVGG